MTISETSRIYDACAYVCARTHVLRCMYYDADTTRCEFYDACNTTHAQHYGSANLQYRILCYIAIFKEYVLEALALKLGSYPPAGKVKFYCMNHKRNLLLGLLSHEQIHPPSFSLTESAREVTV